MDANTAALFYACLARKHDQLADYQRARNDGLYREDDARYTLALRRLGNARTPQECEAVHIWHRSAIPGSPNRLPPVEY